MLVPLPAAPQPQHFGSPPDFFEQLVDGWEYVGFEEIGGDLALPSFRDTIRDDFWHYLQQLTGKWQMVAVEAQEAPEENSKCVLFSIRNCSARGRKMVQEEFATVRLVTRPAYPNSSFWLHIENPRLAKMLGVTLLVLKEACESAFGTVLMRRPTDYPPGCGAPKVGKACLNGTKGLSRMQPEPVGLGEQLSSELEFVSETD
jgi:hypothetical protein